ncbi:TAXI family TRAP transporter solute-binding subunit [Streptomyces sp. H10-C2]|uniref:TAXI family TRAP transporter solute-binding subunit n=1 Tax=unclassified Streptomyces TaxID=2593676 RepID=UPI0024B91880|nr:MULTISPECIES: TAXI family TRAP transporter solute-binding subunit [unclassified Streptomyces]MDJ0341611.1 TAXI family TRAP transporter solute-binding subunit [Streptomyces sp. PH10-H1]MDJ0371287.1 TAXI family TRAP transporter solute-binding subunit [Streptomyces sp. H10-C2]
MNLPHLGRRRALQSVLAAAAALALLLWWLLPSRGPSYPHEPVSFSTGVAAGVYETYGKMLKSDLREQLPGVTVNLVQSHGSVDNVKRVASGRADFTIAAADAVANYQGPGKDRLRACARLYDDYMQLIVPKNSAIASARDLRGKRVGVGQADSGVNLITRRLLAAAGVDMAKDLTAVPVGIDTAPALLKAGKLDAFFWSGGLPTTTVTDLANSSNVKLVQLGDLVDKLHAMGDPMGYYREAVMPADAYPTMQHGLSVKTIAVANLLVTTDRADTGLVERLTRAVIDSRDRIGSKVHAAQLVDLRTAVFTDPLPLHEGARRYYRSVKS